MGKAKKGHGKTASRGDEAAGASGRTPGGGGGGSGLREHRSNPDHMCVEEKVRQFQAAHRKQLKLPPAVYGRELTAHDRVPERPGFLVVVPELLSKRECSQMIGIIESVRLNQASPKDLNPRKGEAYLDRENATFCDESLASALWARLAPHVPEVDGRKATGLFDRLRYYCYRRGQRFDRHVDVAVTDERRGQVSEYTLLVYLNGEGEDGGEGDGTLPTMEGGETVFYATAKKVLASVAPTAGAALLHAHGRRCLMHCGAEVTRGTKYVLRSDIMYPRA